MVLSPFRLPFLKSAMYPLSSISLPALRKFAPYRINATLIVVILHLTTAGFQFRQEDHFYSQTKRTPMLSALLVRSCHLISPMFHLIAV